jgi:alpha-acetolactate decarboxylase
LVRIIQDGAAAWLAHLLQFKLHATPGAAQIDAHGMVVVVSRRVRRFRKNVLGACVVLIRISPPKLGNGLLHHGFHLRIIRDVTADGQCFLAFIGQIFRCGLHVFFVSVGEHN